MYNAAVRIGPKIDSLSAANAMLTACEDTGPKNRRSKSLFARRKKKPGPKWNRNKNFRPEGKLAPPLKKGAERRVKIGRTPPTQAGRKRRLIRGRPGRVTPFPCL